MDHCDCPDCDCPALPLHAADPRVPDRYTTCRDCLAGLQVIDRATGLSRAVEAGAYTVSGLAEPGPGMDPELRRLLEEAWELDKGEHTGPPPQRRGGPTPADYAEMAQSYETDPPRRDEMVGEPFIAPREDPPRR